MGAEAMESRAGKGLFMSMFASVMSWMDGRVRDD